MNYNFSLKPLKKDNIQIEDIIEYFAEYKNLNNLGLIGDAHLPLADRDPNGAKGKIPMKIAKNFTRAVDAPKNGDEVILMKMKNLKNSLIIWVKVLEKLILLIQLLDNYMI